MWDVRPEMLEKAFAEYFRTGKFPPKPADIYEIVKLWRERPKLTYDPIGETEHLAAQASRQEFFESDEYKSFLDKMKREHGI